VWEDVYQRGLKLISKKNTEKQKAFSMAPLRMPVCFVIEKSKTIKMPI